jgi:hypothetical protein
MVALGEDPQEFDLYEQNLLADWLPRDTFQEALVRRIAHNSWRLDRVRRVQESTSVREVEKLELGREVKAENHTRQIQGVLAALKELLEMARHATSVMALPPCPHSTAPLDPNRTRAAWIFFIFCVRSRPLCR